MRSRLALGTVQFGLDYGIANRSGQVAAEEIKLILDQARQAGVEVLDTAIAYGESEQRLGASGVGDFRIVTKLPKFPAAQQSVGEWVEAQVEASLQRLGVSRLYAVLLHRPAELSMPFGAELATALRNLKQKGLAQKIGVSIYDPSELEAIFDVLAPDLVQAPFNILDQRLRQSGWMQRLRGLGVELHVRSVFLQGLLLTAPESLPAKFAPWAPLWHSWQQWLDEEQLSATEACIAFVSQFDEVSRLVVGVDSPTQFAELLQAESKMPQRGFPELACSDVNLINPGNWGAL